MMCEICNEREVDPDYKGVDCDGNLIYACMECMEE